jgi:ribose 5-phosphate isomerase
MSLDEEKHLAAETSADRIEPGSRVGLGTGTTVAYLLEAIARRAIEARYWATSPQTKDAATSLGIAIETGPIRSRPTDGSSRDVAARTCARRSSPPAQKRSW